LNEDDPTRRKLTPASWQPSADLLQTNLDLLKIEHPTIWEELKAIELRGGDLFNETGKRFSEIVKNNNPELDTVQIVNLRHSLRAFARFENGQC